MAPGPVLADVHLGVHRHLIDLGVGHHEYAALARAHAIGGCDGRPGLNLDVLAGIANRDPVFRTEPR